MTVVVASAPGKMILFGEHGVHRQVPNIVTSIGLRTYCRVTVRANDRFSFRLMAKRLRGFDLAQL